MTRLRVVLAEDNYLVREGVQRLLDDGDDVEVVATAASAPELLKRVRETEPDAVLTDIRMPPGNRMDGIEVALLLRQERPRVWCRRSLAACGCRLCPSAVRPGHRKSGLPAQGADRQPGRARRCVAVRGQRWLSRRPPDRRRASAAPNRAEPTRLSSASPRAELDVLREMAVGRANRAIAEELHVSLSAVSKHISSIFAKLEVPEDETVDRRVHAVIAYVTASRA